MKKLMIAAAAAAMIGGAQAAVLPGVCDPNQGGLCESMVFKLTGSGKVSMNVAAGYKSVQSLKISKGFIVAKNSELTVPTYKTVNGFGGYYFTGDADFAIVSVPAAATNGTDWAINYPTRLDIAKVTEAESNDGGLLSKKLIDQNKANKQVTIYLKDAAGNKTNESYKATIKLADSFNPTMVIADYNLYTTSWIEQDGEEFAGCANCYEYADIYAQVKAGKSTWNVAYIDVCIPKWSVFGKSYEKFMEDSADYAFDPLTKFSDKLESEIVLYTENALVDDETGIESTLYMTGFGTYEVANKKATTKGNICAGGNCTAELTQKLTYNGWFIGGYSGDCDEACFTCDCPYGFVFGGTWKAVYDAKANGAFDATYIFE